MLRVVNIGWLGMCNFNILSIILFSSFPMIETYALEYAVLYNIKS